MAYQPFTGITSVVSTVPSSVLVGASIIGTVPVTQSPASISGVGDFGANTATATDADALTNTSIRFPANAAGNVTNNRVFPHVFNGTSWDRVRGSTEGAWVSHNANSVLTMGLGGVSSVFLYTSGNLAVRFTATNADSAATTSTNVVQQVGALGYVFNGTGWDRMRGSIDGTMVNTHSNSVITVQGTVPWVVQSIVGTYAEDAASAGGDKGIFALGIRNDTMASTTSADGDYSQFSTDSQGRTITKPFVPEDATLISFSASVTSTSVTLIAASVSGKRSYITDFWVSNSGANTTVFQFRENTTSVIGTTIAPAGGGSNSPGLAIPIKTNAQGLDLSFTGLTATSILYITVKGYQAP